MLRTASSLGSAASQLQAPPPHPAPSMVSHAQRADPGHHQTTAPQGRLHGTGPGTQAAGSYAVPQVVDGARGPGQRHDSPWARGTRHRQEGAERGLLQTAGAPRAQDRRLALVAPGGRAAWHGSRGTALSARKTSLVRLTSSSAPSARPRSRPRASPRPSRRFPRRPLLKDAGCGDLVAALPHPMPEELRGLWTRSVLLLLQGPGDTGHTPAEARQQPPARP